MALVFENYNSSTKQMKEECLKYKRQSNMELNQIYFWTATINKWIRLLEIESYKNIILDSLEFLSVNKYLKIYAFVIMPNHIHFIIENLKLNGKEMPDVSFLKYTAHQFKKQIKSNADYNLNLFYVNSKNKNYEFWQRDALAIELRTIDFIKQKLKYIHTNPIQDKWQLCNEPIEYKYSSAYFYETNQKNYSFLNDIYDQI